MVPEFAHNGYRFPFDHAVKPFLLRIDRAAHGEILPDHDARSVTQIEKGMILVHISAPAAHDIAARFPQQLMRFFKPFGIPAVEGIQRHPIGTLREDILPVDADPEFARVARQHPVHQLRLSQAYDLFSAVEPYIILVQL